MLRVQYKLMCRTCRCKFHTLSWGMTLCFSPLDRQWRLNGDRLAIPMLFRLMSVCFGHF
eukprot:jgi/Botrbrau1/21957/Bobra.0249s0080.1